MTDPVFHFPDPVWREASKDEEWYLCQPSSSLIITTYGENEWHISRLGAQRGRVVGEPEGLNSLDDVKAHVYAQACAEIELTYEHARADIQRIERLYMNKEKSDV